MQELEIKKNVSGAALLFMLYAGCLVFVAGDSSDFWLIMGVSFVFFLSLEGWQIYRIAFLCNQIREGADILAEIAVQSRKETIEEIQFTHWQERLAKRFQGGAVGDLYSRIWECAMIFREQEVDNHREQEYLCEMMVDISHQIKTPLAALQVFLDIFQKEIVGEEESDGAIRENSQQTQQEICEKDHPMSRLFKEANAQIQRMKWLVTGLLKCTQMESKVNLLQKKEQCLKVTVARCVDALAVVLKEKEQHIIMSGDENVAFAYDEGWLSEAILNVLKNASEHTPEGSEIMISWQQTPLATMLQIEDRGNGIPSEELPKIFNRFYRGQKEYSVSGVGIGLALAKSIVERHGGSIIAESQTGEASFTRFTMTFLQQL
ncbi:MAG: HAMP domain-containing histidine kinase [Lachnospiraceae bacterium]|nr:HAMP domain-containing histidine kinase [Lachnospiraceae bacterium]